MTPPEITDDELARLLEQARPEPTASWTRDMDAWARAGFRGAGPRRPRTPAARRRRAWLRGPALGGLVAAAAAIGIGIAVVPSLPVGSNEEIEATSGSGAAPPAASERDERNDASEGGGARLRQETQRSSRDLKSAPLTPAVPRARGREVETSATLGLAAPPEELEAVAAGVARVTDAAGGYVARSTVEARPGGGTASFEVRVPSRRLTSYLADVSELASVRSRSQSSVDITRTVRSAAERLEEGRAERRGLLRRLERAPTDALRARLRVVNRRIAGAKGDVASAERRVDLSRVSVSIAGDPGAGGAGDAGGEGRWTPGDALRDAGRVLEVAAGVALVALAILVPLALVAAPLLLAGRRRRHLGRERALDAV